jgi:hypothetical protein
LGKNRRSFAAAAQGMAAAEARAAGTGQRVCCFLHNPARLPEIWADGFESRPGRLRFRQKPAMVAPEHAPNGAERAGRAGMAARGARPLVADRRYPRGSGPGVGWQPPKKPAPPKKAPRRAGPPAPQHGLVVWAAVLFLWRMVWASSWRVTGRWRADLWRHRLVLLRSNFPPLTDLLDGRARGSVTMLDRNGEVFAWRGETFGGRSRRTPSRPICTTPWSRPRTSGSTGISASRPAASPAPSASTCPRAAGAFEGNGGSTITQQVAKLLCLGVTYDPTQWKSEADYERTAAAAACGARSRKCPSPWRWRLKYSKEEILTIYFNRAYLGAGARGLRGGGAALFRQVGRQCRPGRGGDAGGPAEGALDLCAHRQHGPRARPGRRGDRPDGGAGLSDRRRGRRGPANPAELSRRRSRNPAASSPTG